MHKQLQKQNLPTLLLRAGLVFVFAYAGVSTLHNPDSWTTFVPNFVIHIMSPVTFLKLFAIFELVLALVLASGQYVRYAAGLAALSLAGLVAFNLNSLIVTFRDVGLVFMAVALFFLEK